MGTVSIYDSDYFNYENVIPNLECGKLYAYYTQKKEITVLSPTFEPNKYTKTFYRKEYDDGIYPKEIRNDNCEYGGRAFNYNEYICLPPEIENTIPSFMPYEKYMDKFGKKAKEKLQIKRLLKSSHLRLSHNGIILPIEDLKKQIVPGTNGIVLHDYNLTNLKDVQDTIQELSFVRKYRESSRVRPLPIGNKYPIHVYTVDEMMRWSKILSMPDFFSLQFDGMLTDEMLRTVCLDNQRMAKQIYYNVTYGCIDEKDFVENRAAELYKQVLFLQTVPTKILLKYDEGFFKTKELEDYVTLLNYWIHFDKLEGFMPGSQNLFRMCRRKFLIPKMWYFRYVDFTKDELRNIFYYFKEHNYYLFKMFYESDRVEYIGGKFIEN